MFTRDRRGASLDTVDALSNAIAETPGARATIVRIKQEAVAAEQRAFGRWFCEAVPSHEVVTYQEYLEWMGHRDPMEAQRVATLRAEPASGSCGTPPLR